MKPNKINNYKIINKIIMYNKTKTINHINQTIRITKIKRTNKKRNNNRTIKKTNKKTNKDFRINKTPDI